MTKPKPKPKTERMSAAEQSEAFKDMARELGADERPEAFATLVKKAAPVRPAKNSK